MLFSRAWLALMRRNVVYRKRYWIGSLAEIGLPLFFIGIILLIKNSVNLGSYGSLIPPRIRSDNDTFTPFTFRDYLTALQAKRRCFTLPKNVTKEPLKGEPTVQARFGITGIPNQNYNWPVTLMRCDWARCAEDGQDAQPLCEYSILALAGNNAGGMQRAKDFAQWIADTYPVTQDKSKLPFSFPLVQIMEGGSNALDSYVKRPDYGQTGVPKIGMGVVFQGNDPDRFLYALRQNQTYFNDASSQGRPAQQTTPNTGLKFDSFARRDNVCPNDQGAAAFGPLDNSCTGMYSYNGVLTFQRLVGDYILNRTGAADKGYFVSESGVKFVPFPTREFRQGGFFAQIKTFVPLLLVLGFLYPVASMIGYIVREKELRQKELMKMMSVTESDIGWSWFVSFLYFNLAAATFMTFLASSLYTRSDGFLMWLYWALVFTSFIVFAMVVATLTSKTTRAVLIGILLFFAGWFITLSVDYTTSSRNTIGMIALHPVAAMAIGIQEIGRLEDLNLGLTWDSMTLTDSKSGYTFSDAMNALLTDIILYGILSWYLNRVIRPDYGQALPFYFPFLMSYWCPGSAKAATDENDEKTDPTIPLEPVGEELKRQSLEGSTIEIKALRKSFGDKTAVDGLSLTLYSGQITALLGHNGAGKTTTINMLTGAMNPTAGTATMAGKDIRTQMPQIRKDLGICLQHDCLFPLLTVREHVQFFSRLKGLYSEMAHREAEEHVDQVLQDVALAEKRNTLSNNLSGGMKRKLSVAMAFCGNSKIVLLDEPTSGMDPFSRRFTWNVIRQYRQNRCIILTTHFMDEADILGDRIAIMAEGRLRCAGSSLFLKKHYGVGYQLTIVKQKNLESKGDVAESIHGNDDNLKQIVTTSVKSAVLLSNVGSEISFQLPLGASAEFGPMFEGLDREIDECRVSSYGVSITTLDEVFVIVARGDSAEKEKEHLHSSEPKVEKKAYDPDRSSRSRMNLDQDGLFFRHIGALFKKRAAFFKRDKKAWVCTTLMPSLFVLMGFILYKYAGKSTTMDPLTLDLSSYNSDVKSAPRNPIAFNKAGNQFTCQPGVCAYQKSSFVIPETNERYYYCGQQVNFTKVLNATPSCSMTISESAISRITSSGAVGKETTSANIRSSSLSLYNTSSAYAATQYGALFFAHDANSVISYGPNGTLYSEAVKTLCLRRLSNYTTESDCDKFGGVGYVVSYNFTAIHVAPLYQTLADEALVREAVNKPNFNISCTIAPLGVTLKEESYTKAADATAAWFLVVLSFPFIGGAFASFVVQERESKAKHLQTVAGVKAFSYWLSTWLWDVLNYQIPLWLVVAMMHLFDVKVLTTTKQDVASGVLLTLFLFGPAMAGFSYCISFGFKSPALCNLIIIISGFIVGLGGPLTIFILQIIGRDKTNPKPNLVDIGKTLGWVLRLLPPFCLGEGIFNAINIQSFSFWEGDPGLSAWSRPVLLYDVIFLLVESIIYLWLAIELDVWSTRPSAMSIGRVLVDVVTLRCFFGYKDKVDITTALPDDDDVLAEQERVISGQANSDQIVVSQMSKVYQNGKIAVNNMSLGIPHGECFGLLGINGAGKTTTMGVLTAEFPPSTGDCTLAGFSVVNEPEKTRRRIGYCPQFDAHFPNLTGREHVELYASIKGVPRQFVKEAAADKLKEVGLSENDSDRLSAGYSGGMKRRLSLACATIGQPSIVFLDECSTGVDPVARREIWQLVSNMVSGDNIPEEERTSVILTTHSMEECEALCPRIGIMANGRLRCLGSAQHLKSKFGQGFQVEMKVDVISRSDDDYRSSAVILARSRGMESDIDLEASTEPSVLFNLDQAMAALRALSGDEFLVSYVTQDNPIGYGVWKDASSTVGVALADLTAFATTELRVRQVESFVKQDFPSSVLRERQDTKVRYEVSSDGIRISQLFTLIEQNKGLLRISDYGVSQTSLEQVFNMHAAEAEKLKHGRDDR